MIYKTAIKWIKKTEARGMVVTPEALDSIRESLLRRLGGSGEPALLLSFGAGLPSFKTEFEMASSCGSLGDWHLSSALRKDTETLSRRRRCFGSWTRFGSEASLRQVTWNC
jgi:hypothetical protein